MSKATRKKPGKRFVAVSCHSDIIEWLEPDWVFHTEGYQLVRGRLRRPELTVDVYAGSYRDYPLFAKNHYLNRPIPRNALVYLGVLEVEGRRRIVALDSYHSCPGVRGVWIGGQGVVLPEFQGLGIGMRFFEAAAELTHQRKHVRVRNIVGSQVVNESWAARSKRPRAAWKLVSNERRPAAMAVACAIRHRRARLIGWSAVGNTCRRLGVSSREPDLPKRPSRGAFLWRKPRGEAQGSRARTCRKPPAVLQNVPPFCK